MRISDLEVRCCRQQDLTIAEDELKSSGQTDGLEFLVVTLKTDEGLSASSFGFAGRSARGSGELAVAAMRPFLVGRHALDRERIWHDFRTEDRWWNHLPIYSFGPFDIALWILGALAAGQPLFRYIGGCKNEIPVYLSSMVLASADDYVAEAVSAKNNGFAAYKTHPPGRCIAEDIEIHQEIRSAVGPEFTLMSDPVACGTLEEAILFGRALEKSGYLWLEEPLPDENIPALRELTRILDIAVVGTEVLAKHPYSLADCIATRVVDRVRADVSWTGGITGTLKTAALAEAFHMNCEIHTTIFHPLELVNLHVCGAVANNSFFELLTPVDSFAFGLKEPLPIKDGVATIPEGPGLGIDFDWDLIDDCTTKIL